MRARIPVKWFFPLSLLILFAAAPAAMAQNITPKKLQALHFRFVGPRQGNRTSAVAGVPGNPNVYYIGAASGGVWKSTDGGFRFRPVFDKEPVQSIGALAIDPSQHSVVWAGTGESWVIRNGLTPGDGVYKSTDGGRTWAHMGLKDAGLISRIVVNPYDAQNVFVCAMGTGTKEEDSRGVWRTEDGGKNWKHVLFVNGNTGCSGLAMDPQDPHILFAGMWEYEIRPWAMTSGGPSSGVYASHDGGNTWKEIKGHGLPHPPVGKIDVAVAPSNPERVYALIQTAQQGSLWRSDDGGVRWHAENYSRLLTERAGYFVRLAVSPTDEDKIYVSCNGFYVSGNGGRTFKQVPWGGDNHDIWIDPTNAKRIMISDDGGVEISTTGGQNWHHVSLPIGQMYHVSADNQVPYWVYANMQDDESERGPAYPRSTPMLSGGYGERGGGGWQDGLGGCESGFVYADPTNPDIIWSTCYGDEITRLDTKVGYPRAVSPWPEHPLDSPPGEIKYRCHWTPPMAIDPFDHNTVYYGCQVIFKTTNGGQTWKAISPDLSTHNPKYLVPSGGIPIKGKMRRQDNLGQFYGEVVFAIAPSPVQKGLIWAGTNDGQVWLTRNGGGHWTNVTKNIPNLGPWGTVGRIEPSFFDAGSAYVAVDRALMGDTHPYIYKTSDFGQTWKLIVNGIPLSPTSNVSSVAQDPYNRNLLFAGTGSALYVSFDDGGKWMPLQSGLPHAPVSWETVQKNFHDLVVSTYGRGIYVLEDITPLEQMAEAANAPVQVFQSRPSYRFFRGAHAYIDFSLQSAPKEGVKIAILDSHGNVVRDLHAHAHPGVNRVYWDMRYAPPKLIQLRTTPATNPHVWNALRFLGKKWRPITHWGIRQAEVGPLVAPGSYTVRVNDGGKSYTQPLEVLASPRTPGTPAQTEETVKMLLHIRDNISAVSAMVNQIEWLRKQLQTLEAMLKENKKPEQAKTLQAVENMDEKMQAVENKLVSPALANSDEKSYLAPYKLYLHLVWLNGEVGTGGGDVDGNPGYAPTDASVQVLKVLDGRLAAVKTEYRNLMKKELPQFNHALVNSNISPLVAKIPAAESNSAAGAAGGEPVGTKR